MNIPVLRWQAQTIVAIGVVLLTVSAIVELASVARTATERAETECSLVTSNVARQLDFLLQDSPAASLRGLGRNPRLQRVLDDAIARAPSVLQVSVCSPEGDLVARSPVVIGTEKPDSLPPFPDVHNLAQAFALVWWLRDPSRVFEVRTPVLLEDRLFATIRVDVAATFLRDNVRSAFYKGVVGSLIFVVLVLGGGFALSGMAVARLRTLETSVSAMRQGRFEQEIPETRADEFNRLARELNLLGRQIREERQRWGGGRALHQAVDLLGEGVLTLGPRREILLANVTACTWIGIDPSTARGRRMEDLLPPEHPLLELTRRLLDSEAQMLTAHLDAASGREPLVAVAHRVENPESASPGIVIAIRRSLEHATLHSLLDESRILTRIGEMAAGVAHELRGPLQTLSLEIEALSSVSTEDSDAIEAHVRSASQKIQRLDRVIGGFLKIARMRPPVATRIQINDLVTAIHDDLVTEANLAGLELALRLTPEIPGILADGEILRQAVENLVRNAIQARPSRDGRIVLETDADAGRVCISVADSGPGIAADDLEHVFDLFYTTRENGTGVGLPLVRQAVELQGGEIDLSSQPGMGTRATIRLPLAAELPGPQSVPPRESEGAPHAP